MLHRKIASSFLILALLLVVSHLCFPPTQCAAGMIEGLSTGGFFDKAYKKAEIEAAPQHDINNSRIHVSFLVDNPQQPTEFFGVYSCGHAR